MKKNLLLGIIACGMLFISCSQDEDEGTTSLDVPEGSIGFTKDGENIILSDCYYYKQMDEWANLISIYTDDPNPQITTFKWRARNDTEDTYQFTTSFTNNGSEKEAYFTYPEEGELNMSWKMTSGTMTIAEKTSEPVTISGTFEGTLTKFENGTATSTTFEVVGKFVKLPFIN